MLAALAWALIATTAPCAAAAHGFDPVLLDLAIRADGRYDVLLKLPRAGESAEASGSPVRVIFPARCHDVGAATDTPTLGAMLRTWTVDCGPGGLAGATLAAAPVEGAPFELIVRYHFDARDPFTALLDARNPRLVLPTKNGDAPRALALRYVGLGVQHIATGVDHLLFVLGLTLLARGRALVATVTAFTLGHSVTLALATLGLVRVPSAPVEACIAASVALLAAERLRAATVSRGATGRMAASFGLLHGLGFAGALASAGLPRTRIPLALAGFNVGVELGQLAFVAVCVAIAAIARRAAPTRAHELIPWIARATGLTAAWWTGARLAACWLA